VPFPSPAQQQQQQQSGEGQAPGGPEDEPPATRCVGDLGEMNSTTTLGGKFGNVTLETMQLLTYTTVHAPFVA
jgi:hypothetical protein